jgi:G3E family GTPase
LNILTTIVAGRQIAAREAAIANLITSALRTAVILEGLPDGTDIFAPLQQSTELQIARIAPGCLCCTGNLVLRVTLNRLLRQHPQRLYISVASTSHIASLRALLTQPPYDAWLTMTPTIDSDEVELRHP